MAIEIAIQPLTKEVGIEAALSLLYTSARRDFEAKFANLASLSASEITAAERALIEGYSTQDQFGYYHICTITGRKLKFTDAPQATSIISNPSRTDWSITALSELTAGFCKFALNEKRIEKTVIEESSGEERQIIQLEPKDILLYCEAEIIQLPKHEILILKFPWYRRKMAQPYYFADEINHITNWISQHLVCSLTPFALKQFFETFQPPRYFEKNEFHVKDLRAGGSSYPMNMSVGTDVFGLSQAYANLDKVLVTTLSPSLSFRFEQDYRAAGLPEPDKVVAFATTFFQKKGIRSQEFFEVLHQTFEYGLGRITHQQNNQYINFKLDYTEDVPGLIRASKLGWDVFELLWNEIKKTFV